MRPSARTRANHRNALLSTGPKTQEGKAAAARNAITHGLSSKQHPLRPELQSSAFDEIVPVREGASEAEIYAGRRLAAAQSAYERVVYVKDQVLDRLCTDFTIGDLRRLERLRRYERSAVAQLDRAIKAFDEAVLSALANATPRPSEGT